MHAHVEVDVLEVIVITNIIVVMTSFYMKTFVLYLYLLIVRLFLLLLNSLFYLQSFVDRFTDIVFVMM